MPARNRSTTQPVPDPREDSGAPPDTDGKLAALAAFTAEHGRLPTQRETWRGWAIGRWLMHQMQRPGARTTEQDDVLNEIITGVRPPGREDSWWWMADLIDRYVTETGEVPVKGATFAGQPLGQWTRDQRKAYSAGRLRADRIERLERVPGWLWDAAAADFTTGLAHFTAYRDQYGTGWVPLDYVSPDGYPLGSWARDRRRFRARQLPAQHDELAKAGFCWERPDTERDAFPRAEAQARPGTRRGRSVAAARARQREQQTPQPPP